MACVQTTCISCYSVFQTLKFAVFQIDSTAFLNDKEQGQSKNKEFEALESVILFLL